MLGNPVEGERRFRWEGEQFLSPGGMAFGLERNVFHRRAAGGEATLDNHPALNSINEGGKGAGQEKVHAENQRGPAVEVRVTVGAAPDRTQLRNGAGHGPRVSGTCSSSRDRLAVAGRGGRGRRAG